jgi:hypothetical protein
MSTTKPWALSPLIATMPHFAHKRLRCGDSVDTEEPAFPPIASLEDSIQDLPLAVVDPASASSGGSTMPSSSSSSLASISSTALKDKTRSKSSITLSVTNRSKRGSIFTRNHQEQSGIKPQIAELRGASQRRSFFSKEMNRKAVIFGPEVSDTVSPSKLAFK